MDTPSLPAVAGAPLGNPGIVTSPKIQTAPSKCYENGLFGNFRAPSVGRLPQLGGGENLLPASAFPGSDHRGLNIRDRQSLRESRFALSLIRDGRQELMCLNYLEILIAEAV